MSANKSNTTLEDLLRQARWREARNILEREREQDPANHWVLTQLGVTFYEQRRYSEALQLFRASLKIVPDCPLTLWNVAGALDALGKFTTAVRIYTWLLQSPQSPERDPCWESTQWADALKTDCVYRLGVCFQHLGKKEKAGDCYREYLNLLSLGMAGSYSIDDVKRQVPELRHRRGPGLAESEVRKAQDATLQALGIPPWKGRRCAPPRLAAREFDVGRRAASKK
jgi:tetratricopeptide (TPR) repeat protein